MYRERFYHLYLLGFSAVIGILAAAGALVFRTLIEIFQKLFWHSGTSFLNSVVLSPWWQKMLIPTCGGLVAGVVITYLVPEARGPGVPEIIVSVTRARSTIRHRVTFLKALVTSLLIGTGASVGREGPIAQIGASVGSSIAQLFRLNADLRRVCLASGAAAGIAATFNAPIAGTLFAVEIILLDVEVLYISHIVTASVIGSVLSRIFWGEFPAFRAGTFVMLHYSELLVYLVLGLSAGMIAIGFIRLVYGTDHLFGLVKMPPWLKPACGGLLLGVIALKLPGVMGVGYETVNSALTNSLGLKMAILLLLGKMVATSLCIGSGMSGGIFAPSLVLGATLGTAVGIGASQLMPDFGITPSNYALAGMGAVVAGTTLAPITAIITIFELTYNYQMILPLIVGCVSSAIVVRLLFGYSAYEMKLLKQGINIVRGHDVQVLRQLSVGDFMTKEFETLEEATPLADVVNRVIQSPFPHFVVLNSKKDLAGILSLRDIKPALVDIEILKGLVVAGDLMTRDPFTLFAHDNLETAFDSFERHRVSLLPVTPSYNPKQVVGILKKDDLLRAYRERVLKDRHLSLVFKGKREV